MACFSSLLLWLPSITDAQEVSFAAAITACGRSTRWHVASGTWHWWSSNHFIQMKAEEALVIFKYLNRCECVKSQVEAIRRSLLSFSHVFDLLFRRCLLTTVILILCWTGTISTRLVPASCAQKHVNIVKWRDLKVSACELGAAWQCALSMLSRAAADPQMWIRTQCTKYVWNWNENWKPERFSNALYTLLFHVFACQTFHLYGEQGLAFGQSDHQFRSEQLREGLAVGNLAFTKRSAVRGNVRNGLDGLDRKFWSSLRDDDVTCGTFSVCVYIYVSIF